MGVAERDYARADGPGGPGRGGLRIRPGGLSVTMWLIIINIAVFIIDQVFASQQIGFLIRTGPGNPPASAAPMPPLEAWGHFSTWLGFTNGQIWRFLSFQFLHANFTHLLFNMVGLWFFGPIVEKALRTKRRFLAFYLSCGICGAALYLLLNVLALTGLNLPGFLPNSPYTPLVGASAGIFGILLGAAYVAGNATMIIYFIPTTVRTGAYILFALAAFNLITGGQNAGGDAAHIGGGIAGYFLIRRAHVLDDFFDIFGSSKPRKGKDRRGNEPPSFKARQQDREKVDQILAKVSREGLQSLSKKEREFLEEQSRNEGNPLN